MANAQNTGFFDVGWFCCVLGVCFLFWGFQSRHVCCLGVSAWSLLGPNCVLLFFVFLRGFSLQFFGLFWFRLFVVGSGWFQPNCFCCVCSQSVRASFGDALSPEFGFSISLAENSVGNPGFGGIVSPLVVLGMRRTIRACFTFPAGALMSAREGLQRCVRVVSGR